MISLQINANARLVCESLQVPLGQLKYLLVCSSLKKSQRAIANELGVLIAGPARIASGKGIKHVSMFQRARLFKPKANIQNSIERAILLARVLLAKWKWHG